MDAFSPSLGLTVAAAPNVNFFTSFATAYETPTTVELSNTPTGEGGFNQELGPQDLRSFEVGIRGLAEAARLRYEAAVYVSTVDNALVSFQSPTEEVFFRNAGESSRDGVELLLEWIPDPAFSTRFAYTYQNFKFVQFAPGGNDFAGNIEPGVASAPRLRRLQPHRAVRPALGHDGPVGRRLHPQQRQHRVQLGVHGRRPALRIRRDVGAASTSVRSGASTTCSTRSTTRPPSPTRSAAATSSLPPTASSTWG